MKYILPLSFFTLMAFSGFSQGNNQEFKSHHKEFQGIQKSELRSIREVRRVSPQTSFLLMDLAKTAGSNSEGKMDQLKERYHLIDRNGILYVNSFLSVTPDFTKKDFEKYGMKPGSKAGSFYTALIPVKNIPSAAKDANIKYIQIGKKVQPTMDSARWATNVDSVHEGISLPRAYFGKGVLVGLVDVGLDYTHPNFYDTTGTSGYRIKRVWEQRDTGGPNPRSFSYGKELITENEILNAKRDMTTESHATHVAGIALGAGGGYSTTYMGVAPKSDLVFVGTTLEDADVMDGVKYIFNYADSVDSPCVINLSLGSQIGPHDGTSIFDQMCDSLVGPGRLLVGAAGNDGSSDIYLGKTYTSTDTSALTFATFSNASHSTNGDGYVDIWGEPGDNFYVRISIYNTNTHMREDSLIQFYSASVDTSYSFTLFDQDAIPDSCTIDMATGINPQNNKPNIQLYINNRDQDNNYKYALIEIRAVNTQTQMWGYSTRFTDKSLGTPFLSGTTDHTVSEVGGTGNSMISVGAFMTRKYWTALNSHTSNTSGTSGNIAYFSSKGPTADGRTKPDIAAPGQVLISSVNSFYPGLGATSNNVVYSVHYGTKDWYYGIMAGTSMAAPMVTGIVALWLEMYPDLTPHEAKELMKRYAITDSHTGTIPSAGSDVWGWGKVNAWVNIPSLLPAKPIISPDSANICAGDSVTLSAPSGFASYKWNTGDSTSSITVNSTGFYRVMVTDTLGFHSEWSDSAVVMVHAFSRIPTITQEVDTLISSSVTGNQWYRNGTAISGATFQEYVMTQGGDYKVIVTNSNGCSSPSEMLHAGLTGISHVEQAEGIVVYPNPAKNVLYLQFHKDFKRLSYQIFDYSGKLVKRQGLTNTKNGKTKAIDLSALASGIYSIEITGESVNRYFKFSVLK